MITKSIVAADVKLLQMTPTQIDSFSEAIAEFLTVWPLFPDDLKERLQRARPEYATSIERLINTVREAS